MKNVKSAKNSKIIAQQAVKTSVVLAENNYGKSRVRLVKVSRDRATKRHTVHELSVDVALRGDFETVHTLGDNSKCLPTDTMKNTVYAFAKDHPIDAIESFALHLAKHFVVGRGMESARVSVSRVPWERVILRGKEHPHCFTKGSEERQRCEVVYGSRNVGGTSVLGGIEGLVILKSTDSGFAGFMKDEYTTLPEVDDRIMATSVSAMWTFAAAGERTKFGMCREKIRAALVATFASHKSKSVQQTLYAMGEAALKACREIGSIRLSLPNKHCLLVNLKPFGMENANEVFVPTDEPHGLIEATIRRA